MASVYSTQYQPISDEEADLDAGLSIRAIRDTADGINNSKAHRYGPIINEAYFGAGRPDSTEAGTAEDLVTLWAARTIPNGYALVRWQVGCKRQNGSSSTTWTLYLSSTPYRGPKANFDSTKLSADFTSGAITASNASHDFDVVSDGDRIAIPPLVQLSERCWFYLTATNGDAPSNSTLYTIVVTPKVRTS